MRIASLDRFLFFAAALLLLFANGRWCVPIVTWIAAALLLRYTRTRTARRAFLGGLAAMSIANYVWWFGLFPLTGIAYAAASIVLGFVTLLPWLLDRLLAPRLGGLLATLVLPCAAVTIETIQSLASPFGSWGSFAYSQRWLPLLQVVSITGLAGVTFLVLWFAAIANHPTPHRVILYASILGAVLLFGGLRLQSRGASDSVRVSAITPRIPTYTVRGDATNRAVHDALASVRQRIPLSPIQWDAFRARARAIDDGLLASTEREARAGARLVLWSEGAGIAEAEDEAVLIARAANVAQRGDVWIALSFLVVDARGRSTFENKNVLVDPTGRSIWTYHKAHPVPGMELCVPGDGRVPLAPTPFGRIATVICFDADFPRLVRQAGLAGADLLLIPADDWREIAPIHAAMVRFRAIEQGLTIVRATTNGSSVVVDPHGRFIASADSIGAMRSLRADIPRASISTLYEQWGDVMGAAAIATLVAIAAAAVLRQSFRKSTMPYAA